MEGVTKTGMLYVIQFSRMTFAKDESPGELLDKT